MKYLKYIIYISLFKCFLVSALPLDSIGIEKKNGKTFVKHKVESGETLYRLTKKYGVTVDEIKAENPEAANSFKAGMVLLIPSKKKVSSLENPVEPKKVSSSPQPEKSGTHIVEAGQGLYSIAKMYGVSVDDIKKWNDLSSNDVKVGQALVVRKTDAAKSQDAPTEKVDEEQATVVTKNVTANTRVVGIPSNPQNQKIIDTLKVSTFKKQDGPSQKTFHYGVAIMSRDIANSDKYEAYYDHVAVGEFINVKNISNEEKVFLKVIGKMPKQADPKAIIVLTPKAFERMQSSDGKLAVEISYIAP